MKARSYRIVLQPDIQEGLDRSEVVEKLAALFKRDETVVEKLLASSPRSIRKGLELDKAQKYVRLIRGAGATARIEQEDPPEYRPEHELPAVADSQEFTAENEPQPKPVIQPSAAEARRHNERARSKAEIEPTPPSELPYAYADGNTCPRCGYEATGDDDVLMVRGDCPRCGLLVKKELGIGRMSGSRDEASEIAYYEGTIPAGWERRALASIYTFSLFLAIYAALTLMFILVFAPLDSTGDYIGKRFLASAFDAFPVFSTTLIVLGLCLAVPFFNGGRSWAQAKFEINLLYTEEAQAGGLLLSLVFRVAAVLMLSFLPGMVALWLGRSFSYFESDWAGNVVTVVSAALGWGASWIYLLRRPDKRSILDLATGTIQIEETPLPDEARRQALVPFAAAVSFWILVGWVFPFILKMLKW
jgi:hypothetical protein